MTGSDAVGVWAGFVPGATQGQCYKYRLRGKDGAAVPDKTDPLAFHCEVAPKTASVVWPLDYQWNDVFFPYWEKTARLARDCGIEKVALENHHNNLVYNPTTMKKMPTVTMALSPLAVDTYLEISVSRVEPLTPNSSDMP